DGAYNSFGALIDNIFAVYNAVSPPNINIAKDARDLILLARAREFITREDALAAGALAARRYDPQTRDRFSQLVGSQRNLYADTAAILPAADRAAYNQVTGTAGFAAFHAMEETMMEVPAGRLMRPAIKARDWDTAAQPVIDQLYAFELKTLDGVTQRGQATAVGVVLQFLLTGGLGLIAIIASVVIAFRIARRMIREARTLTRVVDEFTMDRVPLLAGQVSRGESIDEDPGIPELSFAVTEIDQVSRAFVTAALAVVQAATSESSARQGVSEVFTNLARRNQALLHRQLGLLDSMERRVDDPQELDDLFRLDHLATCMRRHAEGLVILAGRSAGRTWRTPVPLVDVARGAVAEVEDYTRVRVQPMPRVALVGAAVADTIHLLAELIENATMFSPPESPVQVTGQAVPNGFVIEIEDRGLGMTSEVLADANERLAQAPQFDLLDSARLGLFVVARLAQRHDILVSLRASPYGGTTAIVLLPAPLVSHAGPRQVEPGDETPAIEMPPAVRAMAAVPDSHLGMPMRRRQPAEETHMGLPVRRRETVPVPAATAEEHAGLPVRRRQASLAPQLRGDNGAVEQPAAAPDPERSPEEIRAMMAAMQSGWNRGRVGAEPPAPAPGLIEEDGS
ncbi:MAG TPA: nitrate- and nitrite sensing domain-containing protein, partial [Streptosporangiaceae bacterium]|nr:nitrate- and nitrite sensing domain-containing protein [Streptosporangiaceae bacterium]